MRFYQRPAAQLIAFLFLAAMGVVGFVRQNDETDNRIRVSCQSEHREQIDARGDAIEGYERIPPAARGTLLIAGITIHPRRELKRDLHGKYGNNRIPRYCPQHDWPEDSRCWPSDLQKGSGGHIGGYWTTTPCPRKR